MWRQLCNSTSVFVYFKGKNMLIMGNHRWVKLCKINGLCSNTSTCMYYFYTTLQKFRDITFLYRVHFRSFTPRNHPRKRTINSSGGLWCSTDHRHKFNSPRENFLKVKKKKDHLHFFISYPHAERRCSGEAAGHSAHRLLAVLEIQLNPLCGNFFSWVNEIWNCFYLCWNIPVRVIKTNARSHPRWSAVRIKVAEPVKRMTEEIF